MAETIFYGVAILIILAVLATITFLLITNPSLSRNWSPDQAVMPSIHFIDDDTVRINNIHYRSTRDYDLDFYDRTINLTPHWFQYHCLPTHLLKASDLLFPRLRDNHQSHPKVCLQYLLGFQSQYYQASLIL